MSSFETREDSGCPAEVVIEEYAAGRASSVDAGLVERHLAGCPPCAELAAKNRTETGAFARLLSAASPVPEDTCPDDETLAFFLDEELGAAKRARALLHLGRCRPCQERLSSLFREVQIAANPDQPLHIEELVPLAAPVHLEDVARATAADEGYEPRREADAKDQVSGHQDDRPAGEEDIEGRKRRYLSR